jgi:predicted transcriptional regulator
MPAFLFTVVLAIGIYLIGYAIYNYVERTRVPKNVKEAMTLDENKNLILDFVFKDIKKLKPEQIEGTHVLKIRILENLNISPNILKSCLQQLIKEDMILESEDSIALTSFGLKYYNTFIRKLFIKTNRKK